MKKTIETYQVTFEDMTHDARGVCKIDGYPVFVKNALKGETSLIEITKRKKSYGEGRVIQRIETSPFREDPVCEHFFSCGGCNLMHMQYDIQLDFKTYKTMSTLQKIGHVKTDFYPTFGMHHPYAYRNKAMFHFAMEDDQIVAGYFQEKSRQIVPIKRCHVVSKVFSDILDECRQLALENILPVYQPPTRQGLLKSLMIRQSQTTKEILITLITASKRILNEEKVVEHLTHHFPQVTGILQNFQDQKTTRLGREYKVLFGQNQLKETVGEITYQLSYDSFFQVNPSQAEMLLYWIEKDLKFTGRETLFDAYAGVGYIGLSLASKVKNVLLVESSEQAVRDGEKSAKSAKLENTTFIQGDASDVIQTIDEKIDILIVDPPREGLEKGFIDCVISKKIKKMIYVSCHLSTLARDLKIFQEAGYHVESTKPLDMFPHTSHIESVTLLSLQ